MNFFKSGASQKKKKTLFLMTIGLGLLIISDLSFAKDATFFFQQGQPLAGQGKYNEALAAFNKAIELDPKNPYPYIFKGNIKFQQGDLNGALADFNQSIELDPKNPFPYANRGHIKSEQGDLNGALNDYNRAIDLNPNDPVSHHARGVIKFQQEDLKGALADYQKSRELKPDDPEVVKQIEAINKEMAEGPKGRQEKTATKKPLKPKRKAPLKLDLADLMKYFPVFGPR